MTTNEEYAKWSRQMIRDLRKMHGDWDRMASNYKFNESGRTAFSHCADSLEGLINRNKWINNRNKDLK